MSQVKIATPARLQFKRMRQQLLPVVMFVCVCLVIGILWARHYGRGHEIGRVEGERFVVVSHIDGVLDGEGLKKNMRVRKGQVLGRVSAVTHEVLASRVLVVKSEILRLKSELASIEIVGSADAEKIKHDLLVEARRLALNLEGLKLSLLDRVSSIESDKILRVNLAEIYKNEVEANDLSSTIRKNLPRTLIDAKLQLDVTDKKIEENEAAKKLVETQITAAEKRIKEHNMPTPAALEALLDPIRKAITVQESTIAMIQEEGRAIELLSPCDGYIAELHFKDNQSVARGGEIFEVVEDDANRNIILCYVREHQLRDITKNTKVSVFVTVGNSQKPVEGTIVEVGLGVEGVPEDHLKVANFPEWGVPVRIEIPNNVGVKVNEMVSVNFEHRR